MAVARKPVDKRWFRDKEPLIKLMEEIDAKAGIVDDATATPQKVREMMRAQGIRPEDNILSRDIIKAKYPHDEDPE